MTKTTKILIACFIVETLCVTTWVLDASGMLSKLRAPRRPNSIVRLHDRKTGRFFCSGTVVSDDTIITAAHCVAQVEDMGPLGQMLKLDESVDIRAGNGVELGIYGVTVAADPRSDQAIIHGDFKQFDARRSITDPKKVFEIYIDPKADLQSCGYPYSGKLYCTPIHYVEPYNFQMAVKGQMYPGMSGGPIIDMNTGEIVGINTAMMGDVAIVSLTTNIYDNLRVNSTEK